jgi:zinc protease
VLFRSVQTNHSIADAYQTIENLFKSCEALPITPNKQEALEPFAYEHFETPYREIIEKNYIEDLGITQLTLKNGVTVNLKPTDFEQNQIQFSLTIGHGPLTNYPHPQPGIFLAATQVFLKSGLRKNSWKSLTKLLAAKCIQMNFDVDERCFRLFGTCDKKNLLCGLQLMTAYLSDAGFEERALLDARETLKPIYRDRAKSPSSVIADQYRKFITGNSIIAGLPEEQSVFSVTMEAIQKLLLPVFQNEAIELTLVGDFDLEMATKNIQDTLGAISIRSPTNNATLNAGILTFPGEVTEKLFHFTGDEKRALSMLTFLTNDENNIQDNRKLTVLAYLIGDRLRNKTRKEKGNTYSPIVDNNASAFKDFGLFEIILSLNPELIHDTKNETLRIIADLKTTPASQEELDRIKLPILNLIRDKFRQNSFWIDRTMHAHRRPQCLEDLRTMRSFYENISAQDLLQTAQKYLNNPIHSTITRENPLPQSAEKID